MSWSPTIGWNNPGWETAASTGPLTTAQLIAAIGSANIVGIWDADLGITTSGSNVTHWVDQVNSYDLALNTLSGISGTQTSPVFSSSSYNSKAGLTFSGTAATAPTFLATTAGAVSFGTNTSSFFAAATLASTTPDSFARLVSFDDNTAADWNEANSVAAINRNSTNAQLTCTQNTVAGTIYSISYDTPSRVGVVFDNVNGTPYLNNVAQASTAFTFTLAATGRISVGQGEAAGANWNGVVRRVLVLKKAASSTDRSNIDRWLQG